MSQYRLTIPAQKDIDEIAQFIALKNADAAIHLVDKFTHQFQKLAKFPQMGRLRQELSLGLRSFPVENYLVLYRQISDGIEIVRVVSGYRDLDAMFDEEEG